MHRALRRHSIRAIHAEGRARRRDGRFSAAPSTLPILLFLALLLAVCSIPSTRAQEAESASQEPGAHDPGREVLGAVASLSAGPVVDAVRVGEHVIVARGAGLDLFGPGGERQRRIGLDAVPAALGVDGTRLVVLDNHHRIRLIDLSQPEAPRVGGALDLRVAREREVDASSVPFGNMDAVAALRDDHVYLVHRPRSTNARELLVLRVDMEGEGGIVATAAIGTWAEMVRLRAAGDWLVGVLGWSWDPGEPLLAYWEHGPQRRYGRVFLADIRRRHVPRPGFGVDAARSNIWWASSVPGNETVDAHVVGSSIWVADAGEPEVGGGLWRLPLAPWGAHGAGRPSGAVRLLATEGRGQLLLPEVEDEVAGAGAGEARALWWLSRTAAGRESIVLYAVAPATGRGSPLPPEIPTATPQAGPPDVPPRVATPRPPPPTPTPPTVPGLPRPFPTPTATPRPLLPPATATARGATPRATLRMPPASPTPSPTPTWARFGAPQVARARGMAAAEGPMVVGGREGRIDIYDRRSGARMRSERHLGAVYGVAAQGHRAVATLHEGGSRAALVVLDLAEPMPRVLGRVTLRSIDHPHHAQPPLRMRVALDGDLAAVLVQDEVAGRQAPGGKGWPQVVLIELSRPGAPRETGRMALPLEGMSMPAIQLRDGFLYVANAAALDVVDVRDPSRPHVAATREIGWTNRHRQIIFGPERLVVSGDRRAVFFDLPGPGQLGAARHHPAELGVMADGGDRLHGVAEQGVWRVPWSTVGESASIRAQLPMVDAAAAWSDARLLDDYLVLARQAELHVYDRLLGGEAPPRAGWRFPSPITDLAVVDAADNSGASSDGPREGGASRGAGSAPRELLVATGAGGLHRLRLAPRPAAPRWRTPCGATRHEAPRLAASVDAPAWMLYEGERRIGVGVAQGRGRVLGETTPGPVDGGQRVGLGGGVAATVDGETAVAVAVEPGARSLRLRADAPNGVGPLSAPLELLLRPELPFDPMTVDLSWPAGGAQRSQRPRGVGGCVDPGVPADGPILSERLAGWTVGPPPGVPLTIRVPVRGEGDPAGRPAVAAVTLTVGAARVALRREEDSGGSEGPGLGEGETVPPRFVGEHPGWTREDVDPATGEVAFVLEIEDANGAVLRVPGRVRRWRVALPWAGVGEG
jgi:hypothetical protein